jgi:hypothetical protein
MRNVKCGVEFPFTVKWKEILNIIFTPWRKIKVELKHSNNYESFELISCRSDNSSSLGSIYYFIIMIDIESDSYMISLQ